MEDYEKEFLAKTADAIKNIANMAKEAGVKLCVRNDYWTLLRGEKIVDFVKGLDADVSIDVDTANLYVAGVDPVKFVRDNYDLIGMVHITDSSFVDNEEAYKHSMPEFPPKTPTKVFKDIGCGKVDNVGVMNVLKDKGYDGNIVYNCRNSYQESVSLLRTRHFIQSKICK